MNVLDFITSLTSAEARSGQNSKVKTNKVTVGKSYIIQSGSLVGGVFKVNTLKKLTLAANVEVGVLDQISTITEKVNGVSVLVRYAKVLLDEPYLDDEEKLISYLWLKIEDLDFVASSNTVVKPVANNQELIVLYSTTVGGTRLRSTPSTLNLKNVIREVPYGDIVGYTDNQTQKYLTVTFIKVYNSKGIALGWVGKNNVSQVKPQSKALPKDNATGITEAEDPQSANTSEGLSFTSILYWFLGFATVIFFIVFGYRWYNKRKEVSRGRERQKMVDA